MGIDGAGHFIAEDSQNNRILIWNQIPTTSGAAGDAVIGQGNLVSNTAGTSATGLHSPWGMLVTGSSLWVNDALNNRTLLFNIP